MDSETVFVQLETELLHEIGILATPEEVAEGIGLSDEVWHRRIEQRWEIGLPSDYSDR